MSQLKNEVSVDSRLVVGDAVQVVSQGAAQNLPRNIAATQVSDSVISFQNILSIGQNVLIDSNWFIEYEVQVTWDTTILGGEVRLPGVNQAGTQVVSLYNPPNCPNVCFSQYCLSRNCNSISLQFNNVETTCNQAQLQNNAREFILGAKHRKNLASSCPSSLYVSPNTPSQTAAAFYPNQPNTPYWASAGDSRCSFIPVPGSLIPPTAPSTIAKVTYRIREPVFISPLSLHNGPALANIQSINLRYNLDASNSLQGMLQFPTVINQPPPTTAQLSASIRTASIYLDYLTVDISQTGSIPRTVFYNFDFPDFSQTTFTALNNNVIGAVQTFSGVSTNSFKLTNMPKLYYLKISPQTQGLSCANNMCGLPIVQMTIQFGSFGQFTFDREQLWQCFQRNTGRTDMSFAQWVAVGTPVVLNPSLDITSNNIFAGKQGDSGIMFQNNITCTNENYANSGLQNYSDAGCNPTAINWYIYECFVSAGSCQIGEGTAVFKNSTMTEAEFVANAGDMVSEDSVKASQGGESGGSFLSNLKTVLHGARHVARGLTHPTVQAGLSALASGGSIKHGRGRARK